MKTYFGKRQQLRLCALVMGGLLYGATASAANLVSTVPSNYSNSEMGTVTGSRVTTEVDAAPQPGVLKNLNRDPASFNFHQNGKSMLLMRQYTYSTTELEDSLLIDPNSAGAAATVAKGQTSAVPNMHAAAASDEHIYMTGYDLGQIGVVRQRGTRLMENTSAVVNLKNDIQQYCGYNFNEAFQNIDDNKSYVGDPTKAQVHGEALLVDGKNLYVATSVNPLGGYEPYDDGFLMQYEIQRDGSLKFGSYTRISRNIDQGRLNKFNDQILISCIGGYQHYDGTGNKNYTAINIAKLGEGGKLASTEQRRAVLPNNVKATGEDMRDLKVLPNGTAYVMTYNLSPTGSQIDAHVYQTTISNLLSENPIDWTELAVTHQEEGWFGKLNAEYYTKRLWLELGDTLRVYTDGDTTEKYKWQAKDFSDNKSLNRFNKVTTIDPDWVSGNIASVVMTLPAELGGGTTAAEENRSAVWKTNADITAPVADRRNFNGDTVISVGKDMLGDPHTNVIAAISGTNGNRLNINARKNSLQLQVENTVGNPTGIYAGNGTNVTVTAQEVNIITKGLAGGNSLTNAIQLDAQKDKGSLLAVNGSVNISMSGGLGGNGVAIQKSDRLGEKSYEATAASKIRINGDLKIAGARTDEWGIPLNRENVFSRFNNAGILTQVEKSEVVIAGSSANGKSGNADMTVYGNGVTTNAKDSKVRIAGGGHIQVPAGTKYSYYALAAYQGDISMNMGEDGSKPGNDKKGPNIADVKLDGDLFALPTGTLNVALLTDKSYLHGLVDNGGTANLYLQNGAAWLNEGRNARYYQDNEDIGAGALTDVAGKKIYVGRSRVTNFYGGTTEATRGIIYQKDSDAMTLDNYSGHTAAIYQHDAATPTTFKGGDIVIGKAVGTENVFTLFTDANGVTAANQDTVLNALANKLTYKNFADGKLKGKLAIGEGLTASSINKNITFATERGSYASGGPTPPPPSTEQTKTSFTEQLTQKDVAEYKNANVEPSPGNYKFTKDTNISKNTYDGMIHNMGFPNQTLTIDASERRLNLKGEANSGFILGIKNSASDGIDITAGTLDIDLKNTGGKAYGIWNLKDNSLVRIKGNLKINAIGGDTAKGLLTSRGAAIEADGLEVTLNKASSEGWSIDSDGAVTVNKEGTHKVSLNGNIRTGSNGNVDLSLTTAESVLNGVIHKEGETANGARLLLANGAVWNNKDWNQSPSVLAGMDNPFLGSRLMSLAGSSDADKAGTINQIDRRTLTIDSYSGHTNIDYAHNAAAPTVFDAGDVKINKAALDSFVTLRTDQAGVTAANQKDVLDALAHKLFYAGAADGKLTGKLQLKEGLTASAVNKYITFASTQGSYDENDPRNGSTPPPPPSEQTTTEFTTSITGDAAHDKPYVDSGVRKGDGDYVFTKNTTITATTSDPVPGGPWVGQVDAAISNANPGTALNIDLREKNLTINTAYDTTAAGLAATDKGAKLNIKNAGAISIHAKNTGSQYAPGLFVNGGGEIHIENGGDNLENKVLTLRSSGKKEASIAVIKAMNGVSDAQSNITIDGLVDILADGTYPDGKGANEGVSAVASRVDIGGGSIRATGDAWAAIRAYGEFVSDNAGTVNFNVTKGADGLANGAGTNRAVLEGDIVTVGGMGSNGRVSVGLSTADSYWLGNYTTAAGYGVTPGTQGGVNLFMKNGSYWKGFATGPMKVTMEGANTKWTGFHMGDNLELTLNNGSIWHNAITPEQKDKDGKAAAAKINVFKGNQGFIDMTGTNRFLGKYNEPTVGYQGKETSLEEKGLGETGDLSIENFSGNTTVLYRHDASVPTNIFGGNVTIKKAAANSSILLRTDNTGLNTSTNAGAADKNLVSATLNALANKLYYTAYTTNERNLTGKVEIAEGLTASSASKRLENITFDSASGKGSYVYTPLSLTTTDPIKESETLTYDRLALATQPNTKGNRVVSALYTENSAYDKQHPMIVDMNGHSLRIEANSTNQVANAIYIGNNKHVKITNSGASAPLTIKASNTDTRAANGIYADANARLEIDGPVVIEDVHAKGYNASAVQTSGTIGSKSEVVINGDLTVQSVRADRTDKKQVADDGRNLSALVTTGDDTSITVKGNVDIQGIKGSALKTIGANSLIDVSGGTISAAEDSSLSKHYYAVHAEKGTVNINRSEGVIGNKKTNITGDMYVTREYGKKTIEYSGGQLRDYEAKGILNLALTTNDSSWTGAATYNIDRNDFGAGGFTAHDVGQFNLALQNGASWTNVQKTKASDTWKGSRVAAFTGGSDAAHAGVIFQKDANPITIDNYSGHTKVLYAHDAAAPTTIIGGDFRINNAAGGSAVTLTTDNVGLNTESAKAADKNLVSATLNALANKLYYTAYTSGQRSLSGKVEIAEGLTASSASKRLENITFDTASGQGSYLYTPAVEPPPPSTEQTTTEFTTRLLGADADQEYIDANVRQADGTYRFTKDSNITYQNDVSGLRGTITTRADIHIDAADRVLTIKNGSGITSVTQGAGIVNTGKALDIKAKTLKLLVNDSTSAVPLQTTWGILSTGGATNISGTTEIDVAGTDRSKAVQAYGGTVTLEGLHAKVNAASQDAATLDVQGNGRINLNIKDGTVGSSEVMLDGSIVSR